jgi:hypothetical protein
MDILIINGLEMILKCICQSHYDVANKYKMYVNCRKKYNLFVRALETGISPSECTLILYLTTMYVYCFCPAISKNPK